MHATTTTEQLIDEWLLAPAAIPDPQVVEALVHDQRDLILLGDKIYNDAALEERLWHKRLILLLP